MLKILTMTLFYRYSVNIHHLQKMLVTNLVLATKCYSVMNKSPKIIGYTFATRYDAEYVVIGVIIPFVARSECFYEETHKIQKLSRCGRDMVECMRNQ